jgi:cell division protein FtsB
MTPPTQSSAKGLIWAAVFVLLLTGFVATYIPRLRDAGNLRLEKYKLDQQLHDQELEYRRLLARHQALRNDPRAVERVTREKLGLGKPGETIFRFEPENTGPARERP